MRRFRAAVTNITKHKVAVLRGPLFLCVLGFTWFFAFHSAASAQQFPAKAVKIILVPVATPPLVVQKLSADANRVLQDPEVKQRMLALGAEPSGDTPAQFAAFIRDDQAKWSKLMRERGITPE